MKHLLKKITAVFVAVAMLTGFVPMGNFTTAYAAQVEVIELDEDVMMDMAVSSSAFTDDQMAANTDINDTSIIVNSVGFFSAEVQSGLRFTLPAWNTELQQANLRLYITDYNPGSTVWVNVTNDNTWEQTDNPGTSTFPTWDSATKININNSIPYSISSNGWASIPLNTGLLEGWAGSEISFIITEGTGVSGNYFTFTALDEGVNSAQIELKFADPTVTSAAYNVSTNVLTVTGSMVEGRSIYPEKITLTGQSDGVYTLVGTYTVMSASTGFTVSLDGTDAAGVEALLNKNGTSALSGTTYNLALADDWYSSTDSNISDSTVPVTVSGISAAVTSATYDAATHILSVTGTDMTAGDTFDPSKLTLTGEYGNTYTLTSDDVTANSDTEFSVTLNDADALSVNGLLNKNGTSSVDVTTYNLSAAANWDVTQSAAADLTGNGVTVSNVTAPTITSAVYNAKTGLLTVTGANLVQQSGTSNDIAVSKLTLKGEADGTYQLTTNNVEISSATTFVVTLSAADKAGVNAILNQDGTSSLGGTTYNLAAADDWNGPIANTDISDMAGNGITVSNVNQAPVITSPNSVSFAENGTGTVYTASCTDVNGDAVTWSISGGADAAKFSMTGGGLLTFISVPDYEAPADANTDGSYDLTIRATDNGVPALFDSEALSVTVTNANDTAPLVTTTGGTTAFVESAGATSTPVAIDSGVTVADSDSATLAIATVAVTGNFQSGEDVLSFTNTSAALFGNIVGSYNSGTGVLTLSSSGTTATTAQWQAALRAVTYTNSSDTPNTANRTITFVVSDGSYTSSPVTKNISVTAVNDLPEVTTSGSTTAFTETAGAASTPVAVDVGLTVSDADNPMLAGATLVISSNFHSGDVLGFTNMAGITGSYNAGTGVMTLLGTATVAQWQSALRTVTYTNISNNPDTSTRTISITVNDGDANSNTATKSVSVTAANDAPVITTSGGSASFTETAGGYSPVSIDGGITVTDVDHTTLASASVMIISNFFPGQDVLSFVNSSAATFGNIAGSYNSATGVLTLSSSGATASVAQWQAALRAVTYTNFSHNPSTLTRAISFAVNDGLANSNSATKDVTVAAVNDAPTDIALSNTATEAADTGTNTVIGTFSSTDADTSAGFTYTFATGTGDTDNALFNIFGSSLRTNATLSAGSYHVRVKTDDGAGGAYEQAFTITATKKSAKTLATDTSDASVDNNLDITFTGDSVFEAAISGVSYNGAALAQNTDYVVGSGKVTLKPSGGKAVLQTASTGNVVITAAGYENSSVSQTITAGAVHHLQVTTQPIAGAQTGDAFATQPVATLYDQYDNVCANGVSASASVAASAAAGTGSWTLLGTATKTAVNGVVAFDDLTCTLLTSGTGKITFTSGAKTIQSSAFAIPERNSSITPTTASFDKSAGSAGNADIAVTVTFNGNTLDAIKNGSAALVSGTDFEVAGNTCTIKKEYLAKQSSGIVQLTFDFSLGVNPVLTIVLSASAPSGGGAPKPPAQPDAQTVTVLVTTTSAGETSSSATIAATFNPATETVSAVVGAQLAQELLDKALEAKADGEKAVARVQFGTVAGATSVDVELPRAELRQMAAAKAALQLDSGIGTITLGARELNSIVSAAPMGSVSVGIEKVDKEELSAKVQSKIKNNPIYRFEISVGETSISRIAGSAQITLPYTPPAGTRPRYVTTYYLDSNNVLRSARGKYDAKTGTVSLSISRL